MQPSLATPDGFFRSPDAWADPYPVFNALRERSPYLHETSVSLNPGLTATRRTWLLLKHDQVYAALRDHDTFSSSTGPTGPNFVLISDDPPRHTRFRRLVNRAFMPRRIAELEPWIGGVAGELLDQIGTGEADVVERFTIPLPVQVIARLLGIPGSEYATFKRWSDALLAFATMPPAQRMQALGEMAGYFGAKSRERRAAPAEDLITALVEAEVEGEKLQEMEVLSFCILLLVAGNETTTNLMGNMFNALAQRPELWAALRRDRSLVETVIEETLRYESPVQFLIRRVTRDVSFFGAELRAGDTVNVFFGAANRDPSGFPDPDSFRLDRDLRNHVAFGHGIHYCLGSPLARAEARISLNAFLDRYEQIAPGQAPARRQRAAPVVFGFESLPLLLSSFPR